MTPQTLLHDVLPQAVTHALGYTLLHSLWQGALMALLVGVLLRLMHRHSAATRYWVIWGSLMAQLLISVVTYGNLYKSNIAAGEVSTVAVMPAEASLQTIVLKTAPPSFWENALTQGQDYLNQHLPAVVILWLMGMLLMGLRVLGGWVYVQRLKSYRTRAVPEMWQQKAQELSRALGMNQLVRVAESALVQVPMVLGHFKPLILLPVGAFTGLPTAQVEAILAHELAHIHRRDYLLNLLQSMVETLFFFHPAVWWISDCARTEREHACDDLALSLCGDSLTYAYALTNLEELLMKTNATSPRLAVAFSGHRRSLLGRITRLVQKSTLRPSFSDGFLASCAVIAGVLVFSASAWANYTVPANSTQSQEPVPQPDSVNASFSAASSQEQPETQDEDLTLQQLEDGLVIVQNKKGKVVEVYVNGQRIPKSELGKYQSRIDQQLAAAKKGKTLRNDEEVSRAMSRVEASLEGLEAGEGFAPPVPPAPMPPMPAMAEGPLAPVAPLSPKNLRAPVPPVPPTPPVYDKKNKRRYNAEMEQYQARMQEYHTKLEQYHERQEEFHARLEAARANRKEDQELREAAHALRTKVHEKRLADHAIRMKEHEKRMAEHNEHNERMKKHDAMMKELMSALVADGLIKSAEADYDFKLNKNGLFVDGKKQPDALFDKYKKLMQATTGEDVELMLKKDGASFTIQSNRDTKKTK